MSPEETCRAVKVAFSIAAGDILKPDLSPTSTITCALGDGSRNSGSGGSATFSVRVSSKQHSKVDEIERLDDVENRDLTKAGGGSTVVSHSSVETGTVQTAMTISGGKQPRSSVAAPPETTPPEKDGFKVSETGLSFSDAAECAFDGIDDLLFTPRCGGSSPSIGSSSAPSGSASDFSSTGSQCSRNETVSGLGVGREENRLSRGPGEDRSALRNDKLEPNHLTTSDINQEITSEPTQRCEEISGSCAEFSVVS